MSRGRAIEWPDDGKKYAEVGATIRQSDPPPRVSVFDTIEDSAARIPVLAVRPSEPVPSSIVKPKSVRKPIGTRARVLIGTLVALVAGAAYVFLVMSPREPKVPPKARYEKDLADIEAKLANPKLTPKDKAYYEDLRKMLREHKVAAPPKVK